MSSYVESARGSSYSDARAILLLIVNCCIKCIGICLSTCNQNTYMYRRMVLNKMNKTCATTATRCLGFRFSIYGSVPLVDCGIAQGTVE